LHPQVEEGDDLEARCWVPQSRYIQKIVQPVDSDLGRIKNILNENYSKIIKFFFLGDGVKKEVIVNGFYFNEASQEVQLIKKTPFHNAGYMANKKEQVVGSRAMYELSLFCCSFRLEYSLSFPSLSLPAERFSVYIRFVEPSI
jgi:hypothetical protein